jgi:hypothetical protein
MVNAPMPAKFAVKKASAKKSKTAAKIWQLAKKKVAVNRNALR